jgi:hypothetical protein
MANEHHASYRGCEITTRWTEVFDWSARDGVSKETHTALHRYVGSFSVSPESAVSRSLQKFLGTSFVSASGAAENALSEAKHLIDEQFSEKPGFEE